MFSSKRAHALANGHHAPLGSDMPIEPPRTPDRRPRILAKKPAKPGDTFGVPGQGSSIVTSLITVAAVLGLWFAATKLHWIKDGFANSTLAQHTGISLLRVFGAFALACVTAIPIGIMMGVSRFARGIFDPPIEFYRPLPPLAYLPLIIIWFGIGEFSKVFLIYLAIFAPLAIAARSGVRSVSIEQIHAAYSMGASRTQVVLYVILKSALPEIFTGMRIGIGVGWTTLVAAEMVASTSGLGFMVLNAAEFLASDVVIMGIIVIGFFALCFDLLMRHLERVLVPWKGRV
jgi:taurine transport system permease protein